MKALIIAEKSSLMKDIQRAYGTSAKKYSADFACFRGHFMELREPDQYRPEWGKPWNQKELPMIPDKFMFDVKSDVKANAKILLDTIKSGGYDFIVNACDAGREGEAIFWSFYESHKLKLPVKRLWASDTTDETLSKALDNLLEYDTTLIGLKNASMCRMYFDWLAGMNLSRAASIKTRANTPVGRVQTPTLNIVVMRDLEIANFKPVQFHELEGDFGKYKGTWFDESTKATSLPSKKEAEDLKNKLGKKAVIVDMKDEKVFEYAPALFSLTELQKDANQVLGFTAKETLDVAQALYETHKILSYPRTESRALSTNLAKEIVDHLKAIEDVPEVSKFVKAILADSTRISVTMSNTKYVNNAKVTDHHAILNTKVKPNLSRLSKKEKDLYILVIKKFVSIFLDPFVTSKTTIITDVDGSTFKTTGSVLVGMGYKDVYGSKTTDAIIPKVVKGEELKVVAIKINSKSTTAPKPYNDRTLITAMENAGKFSEDKKFKEILNETKGLGTTATRDSIIERLISKGLLQRTGKSIVSTSPGQKVIEALSGKDVISPDLTASWESKLQDIEKGKITYDAFYNEMIDYIKVQTASFLSSISQIGDGGKEVLGKCPVCSSNVVLTDKYAICKNYKADTNPCPFIIGVEVGGTKIPKAELINIIKMKETGTMNFKSKTGSKFEAALVYDLPEKRLKYAFDNAVKSTKVIGKCPKCGGDLADKGKAYGCSACAFFVAKKILGTSITESDVKNLISGKETIAKSFKKGDKTWKSKLKYNGDYTNLEFIFVNDKPSAGPKK